MDRRAWLARMQVALANPHLVLGLLAALLATQILPLWSPTPDGAGYLSIARSIARGGPITNMGSPKLHYPPGYPILISPIFAFSERPLVLLLVMQWCCAIAFMLGLYHWARRWFGDNALWITALAMANVSLWVHARTTMSELPFMALLVGTANALDRLVAQTATREIVKWSCLIGVLVAALALIRPVGVLLVPGYALIAWQQWRQGQTTMQRAVGSLLLIGAPGAIAMIALLGYESQTARLLGQHDRATYLHEFSTDGVSVVGQLIEGFRIRSSEVGRLLVPGMYKAYAKPFQWLNVNMLIYLPLFCGIAYAWWRAQHQCRSALMLMAPAYLALYIAYPSDQGTRYLLPLLPVLAVCLCWLVSQAPRQRVQILSALVGAHLLVAVGYSLHATQTLLRINAQWPAADALAETLRDDPRGVLPWQAPAGARELVMVSADHYVHEARGDQTVPADIAWLLAGTDAVPPAGFAERTRSGNLKLLERIDHLSQDADRAFFR